MLRKGKDLATAAGTILISKWMQGNFREKISAERILRVMENGYSALGNTEGRTCACVCPKPLEAESVPMPPGQGRSYR